MGEPFTEYREVTAADPLRQGDVLEAVDPGATIWDRHLVVITADCDLAFDKHRGRVTCVPLLAEDDYLSEMQIPKIRDRLVARAIVDLQATMARLGLPKVSTHRLREWVGEEEPAEIVALLKLRDREAEAVRRSLESIRRMDSEALTLNEAVEALVDGQLMGPNPPKRENALGRVMPPLRSNYTQPPGDAFFLGSIAPGQAAGYFAYLRYLKQIWEPCIALGPKRQEVTYRRIARLRDKFTHALVQRFALVFMSIGLPTEYEDVRDLHSEVLEATFS
ncbi:hypothetical protein [Kribbella sindirgiensis]|uniref:Uncharacterized protein n=1 Tax=Kribbella sindirgiensis TaxID=1124744 RepID=A0A4R0ILC9_9ACTN|nr:hypothetical protein [Kribbella sindirgiensis]TCC33597.1 hypothetical protein E0H50_16680 [Kribbella sindirgiensis]